MQHQHAACQNSAKSRVNRAMEEGSQEGSNASEYVVSLVIEYVASIEVGRSIDSNTSALHAKVAISRVTFHETWKKAQRCKYDTNLGLRLSSAKCQSSTGRGRRLRGSKCVPTVCVSKEARVERERTLWVRAGTHLLCQKQSHGRAKSERQSSRSSTSELTVLPPDVEPDRLDACPLTKTTWPC